MRVPEHEQANEHVHRFDVNWSPWVTVFQIREEKLDNGTAY